MLKALIEDHHRWTGSLRARTSSTAGPNTRGKFVKVIPHEYKRALGKAQLPEASETISKARGSKRERGCAAPR